MWPCAATNKNLQIQNKQKKAVLSYDLCSFSEAPLALGTMLEMNNDQ